ncbi:MAG: TIGR03087 family PEP-CTERM/XrtA system glycosyltransferase [Planctomycetota bacterium JB042]
MRILYLCHRIPFPPDKGDKIRSYHQVEHLGRRHEVDLFTLIDDPADRRHVDPLRGLVGRRTVEEIDPPAARVRALIGLATGEPLSVRAFRNAPLRDAVRRAFAEEAYDLAFVFSSNMVPYLDGFEGPRVLDYVDVDSAKWTAYADGAALPLRWLYAREGRRLRSVEAAAAARAELTVVCAEKEEEELLRFASPRRVEVVPNGTDVTRFSPGATDVPPFDVVFTGAMDYRANVDAIVWFADECLPRIRERRPETGLSIVGSNPTREVRALGERPGVTVTGRVEEVPPYLRAARVAVAPLRVARGIQNKVLEAMACGTPVVATGAALGGIGAPPAVARADDPAAFADAVAALLADEAVRTARGREGREWVVQHFDWEARLGQLEALLVEAASRPGEAPVEDGGGAGVPSPTR